MKRLERAELLDQIVVGTGPGVENEEIREIALRMGFDCPEVDVDEDDVLSRYLDIANSYSADTVVRITGDCPLIDPDVVDHVIAQLGTKDFATNVFTRTYPLGLDTEVLQMDVLERLDRIVEDPEDREHVTIFIYQHPELFTVVSVMDDAKNSDLKFCVDYPEDLDLVEPLLEWGPQRKYQDLIKRARYLG